MDSTSEIIANHLFGFYLRFYILPIQYCSKNNPPPFEGRVGDHAGSFADHTPVFQPGINTLYLENIFIVYNQSFVIK